MASTGNRTVSFGNSSSQSTGAGGGRHPSHISALDANPTSSGASSSRGGGGTVASRGSYYADDDSVVSSIVSEPDGDNYGGAGPSRGGVGARRGAGGSDGSGEREVATLTHEVETDFENAHRDRILQDERQGGGMMPRTRREWYIVCLAIVLILAVALGTGLGLGFYFMNQNGGAGVKSGAGGNVTLAPTSSNSWPTLFPTSAPNWNGTSSPPAFPGMERPPRPNDLASAIEYHMILQQISDIASFTEMASEGGDPTRMTAQQRARDFLVLRDYLPLTVMDEEDNNPPNSNNVFDNDDPLAIPSDNDPRQRRPYLTATSPAYRVAQRYAAAVLYHATDGQRWETDRLWLEPGVHECDWVGVTCEDTLIPAVTLKKAMRNPDEMPHHDDGSIDRMVARMITAIDLPENNMGGELPRELTAMPYLRRLGLWSNRIGGSLPPHLGGLTRLESLHLDDNDLTGNLPRAIGRMTELTDLFLEFNEGIVGRIPPEIGNMFKLERLRLSNMSLRGSIPSSLGRLTNLVDLSLGNNRLVRQLPEEIGNLVGLESLVLSGNGFTGNVPASWRNLVNLKKLEIQSNQLSFDLWGMCSLRNNAPGGGGSLKELVADCQGNEPRVRCQCCTGCLP